MAAVAREVPYAQRSVLAALEEAYGQVDSGVVASQVIHAAGGPLFHRQLLHESDGVAVGATFEMVVVDECPASLLGVLRSSAAPLDAVLERGGFDWSAVPVDGESWIAPDLGVSAYSPAMAPAAPLLHLTRNVLLRTVGTWKRRPTVAHVIDEVPLLRDSLRERFREVASE